jgi:preprotein translocase subunit SecE
MASEQGWVAERSRRRTGIPQFLREVRLELRKVDWPIRRELAAYTTVVVVTLGVMTAFVFGLDLLFTRALLPLFGA